MTATAIAPVQPVESPVSPAAAPMPAAVSVPPRWTYMRDWDRLGQPIRVTHTLSGLFVEYAHPWTSDRQAQRRVATGEAGARILAQAVDLLGQNTATDEDRAAAGTAILDLDGITAYCACGGLLHYGIGGAWRHIYACLDCLEYPAHCPDGDRARHKVCVQPEPAQCEHCKRANVGETCGCDRITCGSHGCDTAVTS
jgi:hypothetical protein